MISIIVAIDEKRGIGKGNDLLFRIPEDFKRMQAITTGHPIIMGRKTFESIGRVLPKRTNIIVTRDKQSFLSSHPALDAGSLKVVSSLEEGIMQAQQSEGGEESFIFGGGQLFKESIEKGIVDRLYLTVVKGDFGADTFFPEYEEMFPTIIESETHADDTYAYTFETRQK